jgi:hypothetical protein
MLTLPIGHPWPPKASLTSCQAHAFFYKESSTSSSSELNLGMTNSFRTQKWLKTYLFIKVYADPIKFPAFNFVWVFLGQLFMIKNENANASYRESDVNGFTNVVMAWSMMFPTSLWHFQYPYRSDVRERPCQAHAFFYNTHSFIKNLQRPQSSWNRMVKVAK